MKNIGVGTVLVFAILALAGVILWPFAIIFALNTLFPALAINYGFWQWLAAAVVQLTVRSVARVKLDAS